MDKQRCPSTALRIVTRQADAVASETGVDEDAGPRELAASDGDSQQQPAVDVGCRHGMSTVPVDGGKLGLDERGAAELSLCEGADCHCRSGGRTVQPHVRKTIGGYGKAAVAVGELLAADGCAELASGSLADPTRAEYAEVGVVGEKDAAIGGQLLEQLCRLFAGLPAGLREPL
jgi:hypothetical protein